MVTNPKSFLLWITISTFLFKDMSSDQMLRSIEKKILKWQSKTSLSFPNWRKPIFKIGEEFSISANPTLNQKELNLKLYPSKKKIKVVNLVSTEKQVKGLQCVVDSIYEQFRMAKGIDDLKIEHNGELIYSHFHTKNKILVYINDQINLRVLDHIICLRLKYRLDESGGCYQGFSYKGFSSTQISNHASIRSEILVINNNEVLTNYYLVLFIDKRMRIISIYHSRFYFNNFIKIYNNDANSR